MKDRLSLKALRTLNSKIVELRKRTTKIKINKNQS
jgi:hypothetical protein